MHIFKQALKRIIFNKARVLILTLMPVLFIMLFALQDESAITVGIVDKDKSAMSERLIQTIAEIQEVKLITTEEERVYDQTVSYQLDYTLIIEPGFEENILLGHRAVVKEFYLIEKEKLFYIRHLITGFITQMSMLAESVEHQQKPFEEVLTLYDSSPLQLVNQGEAEQKLKRARAAMGFLVQFMIYMSVITAALILEDKNSGVFYRTFYAPISLKRYTLENLLAFYMVGVGQVTLVLFLVTFVFSIELGNNPLYMYILFCVFSFTCVSLGLWLVSLFKKPLGAYALIILITTPMVMLGGSYWPQESMPATFQRIALFLPNTWVMSSVEQLLFKSKGLVDIAPQLAILCIFAVLFLAAGLYKRVELSK